jgi:hypothetical protein
MFTHSGDSVSVGVGQAEKILAQPAKFQRVTRFYYYSWIGGRGYFGYNSNGLNAWDSGLVDWRTCPDWLHHPECLYGARPQWAKYKQIIDPSWRPVP